MREHLGAAHCPTHLCRATAFSTGRLAGSSVSTDLSMRSRRRLLVLIALTIAGAPWTVRAEDAAKPREWKLSVAVGTAFALGQAADAWAKRIAERSGSALNVVLQPGASLAKRD